MNYCESIVMRCYIESWWFHLLRKVVSKKLIDWFCFGQLPCISDWTVEHDLLSTEGDLSQNDDQPPCTSPKEHIQLILEFFKPNGCVWSLILDKAHQTLHPEPEKKTAPGKTRFLYGNHHFSDSMSNFGGVHIWKFQTCLFPPKDFSTWTVSVSRILRSYWSLSSRGRIWMDLIRETEKVLT